MSFRMMMGATTLGLLGAQACQFAEDNLQHCATRDGDAFCARMGDGTRPYCRRGTDACITPDDGVHGCVAARPVDACYSPCGGRSTIDADGSCAMEDTSSSSEGGTTTGPASSSGATDTTAGPVPCAGPEDCPDPDAPFCNDDGLCLPCNLAPLPALADAACAAIDPLLPLCRDDGACVACTSSRHDACDPDLLVCDDSLGLCVPCLAHEPCPSAACQLDLGLCFPPDSVLHIDGDGPSDYPSLGAAIPFINGGTLAVLVLHELEGGAPYTQDVLVSGDRTLAILAAPGESPRLQGLAGDTLSLTSGATVYLDRVAILGNTTGRGLLVDDATVFVDRSRIVQNTSGGIRAQNGAQLSIRSSFVGQDATSQISISLDSSTTSVLNTTVTGGFGMGTIALRCTGGGSTEIRNSLLATLSSTPEISCIGAQVSHSVAESNPGGEGSVALGPADESTMTELFVGYSTGDFHLAPSHPIAIDTAALFQLGDPPTDIDGDPRPTVDATPDFAGADVPAR